jgi:hypothetical protein
MSDCPNCERLQQRIDAHVEVQVMSLRGFTLLTSVVGRDVWARGAQRVPVTSLFCRSVMQDVNDACAKPEVPSV